MTLRAIPAGIAPAAGSPGVASPSRSASSSSSRASRAPSVWCIRAQIRPRSAIFDLSHGGHPALDLVDVGLALDRGLPDFRPNHLFRNARFMGKPVRKLVTLGGVRNPRRDRQHLP